MIISIYGSRRQQVYKEQLQRLIRSLCLDGHTVYIDSKLYNHLDEMGVRLSCVSRTDGPIAKDSEMAISIGGDGTFLRTAAWVGDLEIPILGVNTGHLGYLAGFLLDELIADPGRYICQNPSTDDRTLIEVTRPELPGCCYALNEVAIAKEDSASMISAMTSIDGKTLADYRADGLIIATPTGSTAYNLSVGGPIVEPSAPVFVISPIAAHSLSMRPMVVGDSSIINIHVSGRGHSFRLTLDGRSMTMPMETCVSLRRAAFVTRIVRCEATDFPEPLRRKLMFN